MIDEIIADIALRVKAQLPFVHTTQHIARQDPTGIIIKQEPEEPTGIDDRKDGNLYFRFRDGWDETFSNGTLTSAPNMESVARMRGVFMHFCSNELEIARFLAFAILNAQSFAYDTLRYSVRLRTKSTDVQFIYAQETKRSDGMKDDRLKLVMVDFDVTYKDALLVTEKCVPDCDVC